MRIAYLSSRKGFYGGEVHLCRLASGMRARGHVVRCAVCPRSGVAHRLTAAGFDPALLPLVDWFDPLTILALRRWLLRHGIEILHTHNPRDHYIAAVASLGTEVRNVGTRHLLRPIGSRWLKRPFLSRLEAMIAVSEAVRRAIVATRVLPVEKIVTIPNGIDTSRRLPRRDGLRRSTGLPESVPVVGYVGRLSPEKGLETLLSAMRVLRESRPDARLFVVGDDRGDGRYAARLRHLVHAHGLGPATVFFGYVEDAALACADFDVQVVCSEAEPFGLVTLEAMSHRHPVVVTATGGSPEIVRDGIDGFLVPPGDARALAGRLAQLLAAPHLRKSMGRRGRRRVERLFSDRVMLERTESLYARVLAGEMGTSAFVRLRRPVAGSARGQIGYTKAGEIVPRGDMGPGDGQTGGR
jgi:glycosyltransferase involved in cell wall biosynthesis